MKEFMLLIRNEIDHEAAWPSERHEQFVKKCMEYISQIEREGKLISAQPLIREGKMIARSGEAWKEAAFTETKEVIVGYYHILAEDLNDAIAIAKRNPEFDFGATARIEVRPIQMKDHATKYIYPTEKKV